MTYIFSAMYAQNNIKLMIALSPNELPLAKLG